MRECRRPMPEDFAAMTNHPITNGEDPMQTGPQAEYSGLAQEVELCPVTIRACIEALAEPTYVVGDVRNQYERDKAALTALLPPPPDPAKALVEEFWCKNGEDYLYRPKEDLCTLFARYLVAEGKVR